MQAQELHHSVPHDSPPSRHIHTRKKRKEKKTGAKSLTARAKTNKQTSLTKANKYIKLNFGRVHNDALAQIHPIPKSFRLTHVNKCLHTCTQSPPPSALAPVTQYDFLQIPKSDPGWNISARLPRQFASTIVPLLSLRLFTKGYQREDALSVNVCVCVCVYFK